MTMKTLNYTDYDTWLGVSRLYGFDQPYELVLSSDTILVCKHKIEERLVGFWSSAAQRGTLVVEP